MEASEKRSIILLCCIPFLFAALMVPGCISERREKKNITVRILAIRDAVRRNDAAAIAQLVAPEMRESFRAGKLRTTSFLLNFETGPQMPKVRLKGTEAWVVPNPRRIFGILPGGNALGMRKIDGVWYFTDRLSID